MRRHLRVVSFVAAAWIAVGLIAAAGGARQTGARDRAAAVGAATVPHVVAGPDAFRAALANEADHIASVAPAEHGGSARLLLLLALSLCVLGLFGPPRLRGGATRSSAASSSPRSHQGVGLRAPPSSLLA